MTTDDKIRDEKLHYDTDREAATISALPSRKVDQYEYLTDEEMSPSNQSHIREKAKFTYPPLGKVLKTNKNNWRSRRKTNKSN